MWKESYRVGIESIDSQHYQLFGMVDKLVRTFAQPDPEVRKQECTAAIAFLKAYVIFHFKDEEAYQASIHYSDMAHHLQEHANFIQTTLNYENKFIAGDFNPKIAKEFAGTLVTWLIYHVAQEDQKLAQSPEKPAAAKKLTADSYIDCFGKGAAEVLQKMAGVATTSVRLIENNAAQNTKEIFVKVGLLGDTKGAAIFSFSPELAFELIKIMTFMETSEVDELVCSAMSEISNIVSGSVATQMHSRGLACDIEPPLISVGNYDGKMDGELLLIETTAGALKIAVQQKD